MNESERDGLIALVEHLKGYVRHKPTCDLRVDLWPAQPDNKRVWKWAQFGVQGEWHEALCTCGLDQVLAALVVPQEQEK